MLARTRGRLLSTHPTIRFQGPYHVQPVPFPQAFPAACLVECDPFLLSHLQHELMAVGALPHRFRVLFTQQAPILDRQPLPLWTKVRDPVGHDQHIVCAVHLHPSLREAGCVQIEVELASRRWHHPCVSFSNQREAIGQSDNAGACYQTANRTQIGQSDNRTDNRTSDSPHLHQSDINRTSDDLPLSAMSLFQAELTDLCECFEAHTDAHDNTAKCARAIVNRIL